MTTTRQQLSSQITDIVGTNKELQKIEKKTFDQVYKEYTKVFNSVPSKRENLKIVNEIYIDIMLVILAILLMKYFYTTIFKFAQHLFMDDEEYLKLVKKIKKIVILSEIASDGAYLLRRINKHLKKLYTSYNENNKKVEPALTNRINKINKELTLMYDNAKQSRIVIPVEVYLEMPPKVPLIRAQAQQAQKQTKQTPQARQFIQNASVVQDVTQLQRERRAWYNMPDGRIYRYKQQQFQK